MPPSGLIFVEVEAAAPEAADLMSALDRDLGARYPGLPIHGIDAANFRAAGGVFLVGRLAGIAVACGALRPIDAGTVELKRMYVRDAHRGHGFGRAMLVALEEIARERGYSVIRLETGDGQPEAIALYESAGYYGIPCYGDYAQDPGSVCFEKQFAGV
jgi:GNAT superfamily N-acetyltransferase